MRIVRLADISVVVHISNHDRVTVVVPDDLAPDRTLSMARLVLSSEELEELSEAIETCPRTIQESDDGAQTP